ncbi:hypothetical protein BC938DRAFT_480676 [Jimgerdemannia flammicorona]|uniref:Uncharacterized protein n=1 Tax=Jimgerdemannia flammicorona TaxID=994334 RepID=A0A433QHW0_9FUNG|nr:hypothetical protein BC938DRAFT_480676 [Jimgerdemannia flammicorona]
MLILAIGYRRILHSEYPQASGFPEITAAAPFPVNHSLFGPKLTSLWSKAHAYCHQGSNVATGFTMAFPASHAFQLTPFRSDVTTRGLSPLILS